MFTEKKIVKAISWLIQLYRPEDYSAYDEEEIGKNDGLCLPEVSMAVRDGMRTIYQYEVHGNCKYSFNYCGKELFNQRGCRIHTEMDTGISDFTTITYNTELWLLEDMTFATVRCVHMVMAKERYKYQTEYRAFVKKVESRKDLLFSPEDVIGDMEEMCMPQWEQMATIYEL
ncbi:MAG: hypothetical protein EOM18_02710 [Clostridia bacterium]|nr:hypothetical protein [Clostridia bacterium]